MKTTLQAAIDHLYDVAVAQGKSQSPRRLSVLADYCINELAARGIPEAKAEQEVPGAGRPKRWDVAWEYDKKFRLAISLKSLLKNLAGTVPNRIDDLMGETANVQLHSPEIVVGYVMIFNIAEEAPTRHANTWSGLMKTRLSGLSGRRAPAWTIGTIEAYAFAEVDFSKGPSFLEGEESFPAFFDVLAEEIRVRNPSASGP